MYSLPRPYSGPIDLNAGSNANSGCSKGIHHLDNCTRSIVNTTDCC